MLRTLRLLPLFGALVLASCVPDHVVCVFDTAADLAFDLPPNQCPREENPCYQDFDKDGFGPPEKPVFLLAEDEVCGGGAGPFQLFSGPPDRPVDCDSEDPRNDPSCYRLTKDGGDCDDGDDNAFPGNPEVCDGEDNDCNGVADFDTDQEEVVDDPEGLAELDHIFTCTPYGSDIRIFLRGGGFVGDRPLDGRSLEVAVNPGEEIAPLARLRILAPRGLEHLVTGGAASTWIDDPREGWRSFGAMGIDLAQRRPDDDGRDDRFIDVDLGLGQEGTAIIPTDTPEGTAYYLTLAAYLPFEDQEGPGDLVDLNHVDVGSLTSPDYCRDPQGCSPVWTIPFDEDPDDPENEIYDLDLNVADMRDLDLAACRPFGTALMPMLFGAFPLTGGGPPGCDFNEGDDCVPVTISVPFGCNFVKVVVTDP